MVSPCGGSLPKRSLNEVDWKQSSLIKSIGSYSTRQTTERNNHKMKLACVLLSAWAAAAAASKQPGRSSSTFNFEVSVSVFVPNEKVERIIRVWEQTHRYVLWSRVGRLSSRYFKKDPTRRQVCVLRPKNRRDMLRWLVQCSIVFADLRGRLSLSGRSI